MPSHRGFTPSKQPFQSPPLEICVAQEVVCEEHSSESAPLHAESHLEERLILACASAVVDEERAEQIRGIVKQRIDWSYVIRTASRNGVMPLVCLSLISTCADLMPAGVLVECSDHWRDHARQNLHQTAELIRVLRLLDSHKIVAIPLKGPVLAAYAYHNLSLRQFCDLDILAPRQFIKRIIVLLTSNGFELQTSPTWLQRLPTPASSKKDYGLISKDGQVRIELHWRLSGTHFDLPVSSRHLWGRFETVPVSGYPVRSLPPVSLLLYLTMHGSRHGWERLQWICDIAELLRVNDSLDWVQVLAKARDARNERNLFLGLRLAHELLGTRLPHAVLQRIAADHTVERLAGEIRKLLFTENPTALDISYWHDYHLQAKERFQDRVKLRLHYYVRYLRLAASPTPRDRAFVFLPDSLSFLYFVFRPIRLATQWANPWLKRFRGGRRD